ncbi:hypothetical protein V6N11_031375 [Hibiscus sabdariffa]|uniref:Uncharacterized protein n=1 Tax=Hibiscus sabdariffa TaxID=183260 RepID=A0ABR2SY95_9ROSI
MVSTRMESRIDRLEKTMKDVQGKIFQVKDLFSQLQDWMKKKDEKDIEILQQLKGKSTFLTDSLVLAKVVAENTDDQGYVGCLEAVQSQEETHPKRLELPTFFGDNPCEWLHRAEQYFHFTGIGNKDNLEAAMCLGGVVKDSTPAQQPSSFLSKDLKMREKTESVVDYWFLLDGSQEVLTKWKELPSFEKTWESSVVVSAQFPSFHLEDKVKLVGAVK